MTRVWVPAPLSLVSLSADKMGSSRTQPVLRHRGREREADREVEGGAGPVSRGLSPGHPPPLRATRSLGLA